MTHPDPAAATVLEDLETYYDAAPRASATTEEVGPFTLFLRRDPSLWHYYARPRLGLDAATPVTTDDVRDLLHRQRELDVPQTIEWVHETTPTLLTAARAAGMDVEQCPLMVHAEPRSVEAPAGVSVSVLDADAAPLGEVLGAIQAGFSQTDDLPETKPERVQRRREQIRAGLISTVAAYDGSGAVVGGGSHGPRGATTELAGIAVLPRARRRGAGVAITAALVEDARARGVRTPFLSAQDDDVARVYARVGFVRVGTACIAKVAVG